jgi:paraquat-inducible protein B
MHNFLQLIIIILVIALSGACQTNQKENGKNQLRNEVIEIHDEIMPEMQTTYNLRKRLSEKLDSIQHVDSEQEIEPVKNEIEVAIQKLNEANQNMMQWMRNFNPDFQGEQEDEKMAYYQIEKDKIVEVQDQFSKAILQAEETLTKLE